MKKAIKKALCLLLVLSVVLTCTSVLAACLPETETPQNEPEMVSFTDGMGRNITLDVANVEKVVCVGAGALRLYSYVGDMSKLCAVEEIEGSRTSGRISLRAYQIANEELFASLINEGKTAGAGGPQAQELKTETLIKLKPDVVFSCLTMSVEDIEAAETALGCPIVTLKYGQKKAFSNELIASLEMIGKVCKTGTRVKEITDYIAYLKADILSLTEGKSSKKVYLACNSNWGVKGFLSTAKNYPIFTISGINNVMDVASVVLDSDGFADMEAVIASDADAIILDAGGLQTFKNAYLEDGSLLPSQLSAMSAFANKEVYLMMPNNAYDANVEMYFVNAYYAMSVAFDVDIDIEAKTKEITKKFVGKELYSDLMISGGYRKMNLPDEWAD